jgi:hypothetical protein
MQRKNKMELDIIILNISKIIIPIAFYIGFNDYKNNNK